MGTRKPKEENPPKRAPSQSSTRSSGRLRAAFDRFAGKVTQWTGSPYGFAIATIAVVLWGVSGPLFGYSETWQLVINTGTTIVTFLMVFLIQQSQNKDSHAVHLKLDELLCAVQDADDRLVDIENLDEDEIDQIAQRYQSLAEKARSAQEIVKQRKAVGQSRS